MYVSCDEDGWQTMWPGGELPTLNATGEFDSKKSLAYRIGTDELKVLGFTVPPGECRAYDLTATAVEEA